jgi:hypothetical protein
LAGYLRRLKSSVLIGFEATGNYRRPLAYFVHRQGFELRLIPTLALPLLVQEIYDTFPASGKRASSASAPTRQG